MKNELLEVKCEYLDIDAKGVVKSDKGVYYIPFLLPNERAKVMITETKGQANYGKIIELIESSCYREKERCANFSKCGGCQLRHLNYQQQLLYKQNNVYLAYKNQGMKIKIDETVGMLNPDNYRNKVIASFTLKNKEIVYGLYEENTHNIIGNTDCGIQNIVLNNILKTIKQLMKKNRIMPYDDFSKKGCLKHVLLRIGKKTNEVMVVFVTTDDIFPGRNELTEQLISIHKEIKTVIQNTNSRHTSIVLGDKERVLFGKGYIIDELLGVKFMISSKSFYQINPDQTEVLYSKALELANLKPTDTVLDAYCGIGTISLIASKKVKKVYGVEIVRDAIKDAINNAKENNIKNALFFCDDAKKFISSFTNKIDCLIVDPPRKGCDQAFIDSIARLKPNKIVYVSCDPFTQAEDIKYLLSKTPYSIKKVIPVDMFPYTNHVESVVLMSRDEK